MKQFFFMLAVLITAMGCAGSRYAARPLVQGGALRGVHSMTVGHDGLIYAASPFSNHIAVIDPETLQWRFLTERPIGMPWEIAAVGKNRLVFYDAARKSLETCPASGGKATVIRQKVPAPMTLTSNADGRLFAAMAGENHELCEISSRTGDKLFLISEKLGRISAMAGEKNGGLWVAPATKPQLALVNTLTGEIKARQWPLSHISAMVEDEGGSLWIAGQDATQPVLWQLNTQTGERREIELPVAFSSLAASGEKILAAGRGGESLWALSPEINSPIEFYHTPLVSPGGLCLVEEQPGGSTPGLYVADMYAVKVFAPDTGTLRRTFAIPDYKGRAVYPTNVGVSDDFLIVTSWISGTVHLLEPQSGRVEWVAGGLLAPMSAVVLPGGDVLVAELASSQIVRLSRFEGRINTIITTDQEGPRGPCGMVLSPTGGVYVTENFGGKVSFVDPYAFFYKPIAEGLQGPEGLTVTEDGSLLVVETGRRRLVRVDPGNGGMQEVAGNLPVGLEALGGLPPVWFFSGVAVSRTGEIFISGDRDNSIQVLTLR